MQLPIGPDIPWLAPLAGFSDLPFRLLCRSFGSRVACTEMVSAKGLVFQSSGTRDLLRTCPEDNPLVVQLFGSEPAYLGQALEILLAKEFSLFDLNSGCAVKKVTRTGSGAALMKDPERLVRCAARMVSLCGPGKVGVKIRRGWSAGDESYLEIGKKLQDTGIGWITLHPRWAVQGFSGQAEWDCLARLRAALSIPVLGSGDLLSAEEGAQCIQHTDIQGVMFARGALRDPRIFQKYTNLIAHPDSPSQDDICIDEVIQKHRDLCLEYGNPRQALLRMRTVVPRYLRCLPGVKSLRSEFTLCSSWEEFDDLLNRLSEKIHPPNNPANQDSFNIQCE